MYELAARIVNFADHQKTPPKLMTADSNLKKIQSAVAASLCRRTPKCRRTPLLGATPKLSYCQPQKLRAQYA